MKDLTKHFVDLSKCSEEQIKKIENIIKYKIDEIEHYPLLIYLCDVWNQCKKNLNDRTELTYPEFIKLFEEPKTVTESLKEYFKNTPKEQVIKDWESVSEFDNVNSPKVSELFEGEDENEDFTKVTIEMEVWQLKNLRNYFGRNDKTPFEHLAFDIFNKSKPSTLEAENKELREMLEKSARTIRRLKLSMMAHPDYEEESEFDYYTTHAQQIEDEIEELLNKER